MQGLDLIPPPPVVRARLAQILKESRLLRSLLRLSVRADTELSHRATYEARQQADSRAVAR
jgi:hypothetical protein